MPEISKTCYDKILPRDLRRFSSPEFGDDDGAMEMAVFKAKRIDAASTLYGWHARAAGHRRKFRQTMGEARQFEARL